MGLRAYLLVKMDDDMERDASEKALRQVEAMPEVDFADPVVGGWDLVLMVETSESVSAVADKVSKFPWVKQVDMLKITNSFERHKPTAV